MSHIWRLHCSICDNESMILHRNDRQRVLLMLYLKPMLKAISCSNWKTKINIYVVLPSSQWTDMMPVQFVLRSLVECFSNSFLKVYADSNIQPMQSNQFWDGIACFWLHKSDIIKVKIQISWQIKMNNDVSLWF